MAVTRVQHGEERPVAFLSRHLSKSELKWGRLEQQVSLVSWGLRKVRRYSSSCPEVVVRLEQEEEVCVVLDSSAHMRLRALMVDLTLYRCRWEAAWNPWKLGEGVIEHPSQTSTHSADVEPLAVPQMIHADVKLRRR